MELWAPDLSERLGLPQDVALSGILISAVRETMKELWPSNSSPLLVLEGMSAKRRAEFLAGRLCAARSLGEMGIVGEFPLPVKDRLPVWPSGVLGSISHCTTLAVAMAAMKSKYRALGIDVESLINSATARSIWQSVCSHEELTGLERCLSCRMRSLTLLFSAKEALYKALFPLTGRFRDFHAVEFCGCEAGSVILRLTHDWTSRWRVGTKIRVRHVWLGRAIICAVCVPVTRKNQAVVLQVECDEKSNAKLGFPFGAKVANNLD